MKLWGGRFKKQTNELVEEYTASISFDKRLYIEDILGSLAHVTMLAECGIIPTEDAGTIKAGLAKILKKIEAGSVKFTVADEDIHMNIERLLHEEIGTVAGKLHTGRSRNDQVALDMHLFLREQIVLITELLANVKEALLSTAKKHTDTILPGYTHLQRAQPVLLAHHLLAYFWMFDRDSQRMRDAFLRTNHSPLGAGALAGTTFPIKRERVAELLKFEALYENSLDAVSDRDYIVEFLSAGSLIITHLSRLSEELIVWSSTEFDFVELDDAFTTGSSIMPQKKNPDVAELVRGKTGRVFGNLISLLTTLKGLPLAYNKDMQEDKEGMFDTVDTLTGALALFAPMLESMEVKSANMLKAVKEDFSNATDLADYLVNKGLPFREAHEVIGTLVAQCLDSSCFLADLALEDYQKHSSLFESDLYAALNPETVVAVRSSRGGTGGTAVADQIEKAAVALADTKSWLESTTKGITLDINSLIEA
jgi:argininosuccinate lyase